MGSGLKGKVSEAQNPEPAKTNHKTEADAHKHEKKERKNTESPQQRTLRLEAGTGSWAPPQPAEASPGLEDSGSTARSRLSAPGCRVIRMVIRRVIRRVRALVKEAVLQDFWRLKVHDGLGPVCCAPKAQVAFFGGMVAMQPLGVDFCSARGVQEPFGCSGLLRLTKGPASEGLERFFGA